MFHKRGRIFAAAFTLFISLVAGNSFAQTKTLEEIVAWVNNDVILKSEFEARRTAIREDLSAPQPRGQGLQGAQLESRFAEQSKLVLRQLIDETLILQQARDMGLSADTEIIKTMDRLRQE